MPAEQALLLPSLRLAVDWKVLSLAEAWCLQDLLLMSSRSLVAVPPPLRPAAARFNLLQRMPGSFLLH